eukprot:5852068-Prorocentrum_lima.AAC.1
MTSSLVGSEMCIRDSSKEQTSYHSDRPWPRLRASPPGNPPCRSALRLKTCLLYTSDAADDM